MIEVVFLGIFQGMLMLLVQGPYFENHDMEVPEGGWETDTNLAFGSTGGNTNQA